MVGSFRGAGAGVAPESRMASTASLTGGVGPDACGALSRQHFLNFFPEPQGHGSFRPALVLMAMAATGIAVAWDHNGCGGRRDQASRWCRRWPRPAAPELLHFLEPVGKLITSAMPHPEDVKQDDDQASYEPARQVRQPVERTFPRFVELGWVLGVDPQVRSGRRGSSRPFTDGDGEADPGMG